MFIIISATAGPGGASDAWIVPLLHHLKTLGTTLQPVLKGKDLSHAFGLNHRYVYEEVPSESLAFAPNRGITA